MSPSTRLGTGETRVVNVRSEPCDVYIGRDCGIAASRLLHVPPEIVRRIRGLYRIDQSPFGNPFRLGIDGDRDEVISRYRAWMKMQPDLLARLPELRGKRLGCWCAPKPCHGDVLVELVNALPDTGASP